MFAEHNVEPQTVLVLLMLSEAKWGVNARPNNILSNVKVLKNDLGIFWVNEPIIFVLAEQIALVTS